MAQGTAETVTGIVASVNDGGLKLEGESTWRNFTKQRELPRPEIGDRVTLRVAGQWINELVIGADGPAPAAASSNGASNGHISERDLLTARMSALKSACSLARGKEVHSTEVLKVANKYLSWLLGEER